MRRVGNLFGEIVSRDNLLLAYVRASRGKVGSAARIAYAHDLESNIGRLAEGLLDGTYMIGSYSRFTIHDPKEREICAAPFCERVLHHALMNVCAPFFERWSIYDSYASRKGKGQVRAVERARSFAGRYGWFLKCDIKKYFDSVPHDGLLELLRRKFKDARLLAWFERIVRSYAKTEGRGLPIGNLTSQYFANLYLDRIDRLHRPYVRYMDDFVFWSDDRSALRTLWRKVRRELEEDLGLELNPNSYMNRSRAGMDFLGYRIYPCRVDLSRNSARRYVAKVRHLERARLTEIERQSRLTSLTAFVSHADSMEWRRRHLSKMFP